MSDQEELEFEILTISHDDTVNFRRLDHYLKERLQTKSRSFLKKIFQSGLIELVETKSQNIKLDLKKMPPAETKIQISFPPPIPTSAKAENIPLEVLYEDEHIILINKHAGIVTHPAPGNYTGTLVNALLYHCKDLQGIGGELRPGIVHRLDKGTSGVMIMAKTHEAMEKLILTFSTHDLDRKYEAIVFGQPKEKSGEINSTIGRNPQNRLKMKSNVKHGKEAKTFYNVINYYKKTAHVEFTLYTGRTHQIRVHAAEILKCPLLADPTYAKKNKQMENLTASTCHIIEDYDYPFLHAKKLELNHPITGKLLSFETKSPEIFQRVLDSFEQINI